MKATFDGSGGGEDPNPCLPPPPYVVVVATAVVPTCRESFFNFPSGLLLKDYLRLSHFAFRELEKGRDAKKRQKMICDFLLPRLHPLSLPPPSYILRLDMREMSGSKHGDGGTKN